MTLLTTTPTTPSATPSPPTAVSAPNRQSRAHCWAARDTFFACLEQHGIIDSIKESERAGQLCGLEGKGLERECAASWVSFGLSSFRVYGYGGWVGGMGMGMRRGVWVLNSG